jgi:hypothetical protein
MDDRWKGTQCLNTFTVANSSLGDKKTTECRGFLSESGRNIAATPVFHARDRMHIGLPQFSRWANGLLEGAHERLAFRHRNDFP